jgi:RNA-binding protein
MSEPKTNELTSAERRALRARAHHLQPVVMIGDAGLSPAVLAEIETNLKSHELIKIRVLGDEREARAGLAAAICDASGAQPIQHIGKLIVIYRPRPPEEKTAPKKKPRPKPARKTKRSYQRS